MGYKRPLQKEDLWHWDEDRRTKNLADKLTANIEKRRKNGKTKHILLMALNETFFWQFWTAGFLKVCCSLYSVDIVIRRLRFCNVAISDESTHQLRKSSLRRSYDRDRRATYRSWHRPRSGSRRHANRPEYMSTPLLLPIHDGRRNVSIRVDLRHLSQIPRPLKQGIPSHLNLLKGRPARNSQTVKSQI